LSRKFTEESALSRYDELLSEFINLAINRFTWKNLPLGLTTEKLEEMLISHGQVMAFKRTNGGLTILQCSGTADINVYGLPTEFMVMGANGFSTHVNLEDGILIKNNPLATPNISTLEKFAKRIDDTEMTQDVNLFQQNIPKIILADENGKLTAKAIFENLKKFKFVLFGKKSVMTSISSGEVLDTSAPYLLDKLQDHKSALYNELLTILGINNNNVNKKERLIVDEVNANNDLISINLDLMFDMRKNACDEMNTKFGTNITVEKRSVEDGDIYNGTKGDTE
jgi:hypothetical protein